jgi:Raf kinase inhibitor-like YbhB/YbcL family protein
MKRFRPHFTALGLALIVSGCARDRSHRMALSSPAFKASGAIPKRHTCAGENLSPPLEWRGVPPATRSFAFVVDDPDADGFTHWTVFNLAPELTALPEGARPGAVSQTTREGSNDFGSVGYGGPCPPFGRHRYSFRLYALDVPSISPTPPTKARLRATIEGHILAEAELIGAFER